MRSTRQILIAASRVVVGPSGQVICPGAVLIDGKHISAVGDFDSVNTVRSPDAVRLDYPDASVLAGLIDAHVHLAFTGLPDQLTAVNSLDDASASPTASCPARACSSPGAADTARRALLVPRWPGADAASSTSSTANRPPGSV